MNEEDEMARGSEVLHCYSRLAQYASSMAALAVARDWGRLPELELNCAVMIERLKGLPAPETLPEQLRDEARVLIQRIRADQETVVQLVRPQLQSLLSNMGTLNAQKNLSDAYGGTH
ncbi:flagellar protein FliT [Variovorax sp.]|uniref:flagellar protein FliT n=1 Tax=Variovorax sp. TaxID=1871043 RepID=UPI002D7813E4|nr:flagellar protein FliT [Variovorax sp.]